MLLHWSAADPIDGNPDFVPAAGVRTAPHKPAEAMSVEELFLSGVEAEKDGSEQTAEATYLAVLKRDPGYIPALVKMAWHELRAGNFRSAEGFLAPALARDDRNPETLYAAGVVYRAEHRWSKAQDMFWADIRFGGDPAPAYAQLGEIALTLAELQSGDPVALSIAQLQPEQMRWRPPISRWRCALPDGLPRRRKRSRRCWNTCPCCPMRARNAGSSQTAQEKAGQKADLDTAARIGRNLIPPPPKPFLQVAAWYRTLGDVDDSDAVLQFALKHLPAQAITPLVYYYLAANAREKGNDERADDFARQGEAAPYAKVFPNRLADAEVIDDQLRDHPLDAHALYFMGNYLFAHGRYEEGARSWDTGFWAGF